MIDVRLYQIAYSDATYAAIEPGYRILDNRDNLRPDWYEYWPIRRFLQNETLDDDAWYGFFSPKFGTKTQMTHADVVATVRAAAADCDVVLFSPQPDMGAFFLNVFEQGETFDPGLIDAMEAFLRATGIHVPPLRTLVMDSRQTVFSNYFVARPAFWRAWFNLAERFFAACEGPPSDLQRALNVPTTYPGGAQRKVFLSERLASLLLTIAPEWRAKSANTFRFGWSMSRLREHPQQAVISDALKIAFRDQGFPEYIQAFGQVREAFIGQRGG